MVDKGRYQRYQRKYYYQNRDKYLKRMREYKKNRIQVPKDNQITRDYTPVTIYWN